VHFNYLAIFLMKRFSIGCLLLALLSTTAGAADKDAERVRNELAKSYPEIAKAIVRPAPAPGLYEIEMDNQLLYATADGKFLVLGNIVEAGSGKNLTVVRQLDTISEKDMIVIGPQNAKRTITVFTDVDCPYCARIHQEVPELNKAGVKVRYLLFPRSGLKGETYQKSVAVWCADDRAKAIGVAKAGGKMDLKTCANPVDKHYNLGLRLDVSGTPTIFTDNGARIGGYMPAARLLAAIGVK
jgi:thiol:disulfide interchange protein DsbC